MGLNLDNSWITVLPPDETGGGGGDFLKLADKEEAEIILCAAPMARTKEWDDGPKESRLCAVYNVQTKQCQVLDASMALWSEIRPQLEKAGQKTVVLEIARRGSGKQTRWGCSRHSASKEEVEAAAYEHSVNGPNLGALGGKPLGTPAAFADGDDIPF